MDQNTGSVRYCDLLPYFTSTNLYDFGLLHAVQRRFVLNTR